MNLLFSPNPRKRGKKRRMTAKQRKYFGGGKRARRRSRRAASAAPAVVHVARRSRRTRRSGAVSRISRRARRSFGGMRSGAMGLLKSGAIGGAGAVAVDVTMGQVRGMLPASMSSPQDSAGGVNYGYFAVKAAIALLLGLKGNRLPVVGPYASRMAEGSLTIMAYQFMRPLVPANLSLGAYFNPAPTMRPRVNGLGAYAQIPVRAGANAGNRGGRAASVLSMVDSSRRSA